MVEEKTIEKWYFWIDLGKALSSVVVFLIGAISKILATLFTYPYTLLRTRQQIVKGSKGKK
jgi:hypothetical protein